MPVRLKDIAQELGVSTVTVSKALRNHPDIAEATKQKILARVKALNYRPNLTARSLVTGRSSLIGLVVPDLIHPYFSEIAKALSAALRKKGYFLIVSSSDSDPVLEQNEIEHMLQHRLDCLIVASCQKSETSLRSTGAGNRLILLDRNFAGFACNFVGVNDDKIGALATEHLIAQGCKRIAHIRGPENNVGNRRAEGCLETLRRHGLPVSESTVISVGEGADSEGENLGAHAMDQILKMRPYPDGIFCFNDVLAVGAMTRALEAGLRVPRDMAIIGCGNYHYCSKLRVPLSSIDQNPVEMGKRIARMIAAVVEEPSAARPRSVILEPSLVVRASTQRK